MKAGLLLLCLTISLTVQVKSHSLKLSNLRDEEEDAMTALNDLTELISSTILDAEPEFRDILRFIETGKTNCIMDTKTAIDQMSTTMISEITEWKNKATSAHCDITECTAKEGSLVELPAEANDNVYENAKANADTGSASVGHYHDIALNTVDLIDLRSNQITACGSGETAAKCFVKATADINKDIKQVPTTIEQSRKAARTSYTLFVNTLSKNNRKIVTDFETSMASSIKDIITCIKSKLPTTKL